MTKFKPIDCDIIYLSYDEPNAEQNYADLCKKVPWAKRVHGVEGSDAAHKACARLSETDRFITVDGDNRIKESFLNQVIDFDEHADLSSSVISWAGRNVINGLIYGNGGLKCWPKDYVLKMRTHENADPNNAHAQVDFCWDTQYIQMEGTYCDVHNNHTPQQAWRAGFREGCKMALDRGLRVTKDEFAQLHWKNLHRLYIWLMIGADTENGDWAILGARAGLYMTMCTDWDYVQVRDFEYLNNLWTTSFESIEDIDYEIGTYGIKLINELDIPIAETPLGSQQSKFFKTIYQNPMRMLNQFMEKE
tara:strand:+ start:1027 stop:1941 length:915 start_codon:yes stop_codon:yes gene_type:complete